jgi:hypothetical protein
LGFATELGIEMPLLEAVVQVNEGLEAAAARRFDVVASADALNELLVPADSSPAP